MVDQYTVIVLMLFILGIVWTLVQGMYAVPFTRVERRIEKLSRNPEISNRALLGRFNGLCGPALGGLLDHMF